jgi:hypothetical protein
MADTSDDPLGRSGPARGAAGVPPSSLFPAEGPSWRGPIVPLYEDKRARTPRFS